MDTQNTAQGLASLGRNGDSMLVHMSPHEVAGLNYLAKKQGGSLTINPHTGMPEAFKLGGLFKSLLPMAAGWALGPGGFGLFEGPGAALMSGLTVGAATGLMTGNLGQGLMAGLGAYGGADLGNMFKTMGTSAPITPEVAANALEKSTGANLIGGTTGEIGMSTQFPGTVSGLSPYADVGVRNIPLEGGQVGMANSFPATMGGSGPINPTAGVFDKISTSGFGDSGRGIGTLFESSRPGFTTAAGKVVPAGSGWEQFTNPAVGGSAFKVAAPVGAAILGGLEPSDLQPNVNLAAGEAKNYEQTGVDAQGNPTYGYVAASAYNPYRSLNLGGTSPLNLGSPSALKLPPTVIAKEGGEIKSYAIGGNVANQSVGAGLSDLYNMSDGANTPAISQDGYGIGRLASLARAQSIEDAKVTGYANGGDIGMNLNDLPTLNVKTGKQVYGNSGNMDSIAAALASKDPAAVWKAFAATPTFEFTSGDFKSMPNPIYTLSQLPKLDYKPMTSGQFPDRIPVINTTQPNTYGFPAQSLSFKAAAVPGMARGGYLDGAGDGMSDSIPATIEGKQPARLADGEFVVPADVVSHLGNGSTKAGSKRLYAMLDKVRKARTGTTKQGKQIHAEKYIPV